MQRTRPSDLRRIHPISDVQNQSLRIDGFRRERRYEIAADRGARVVAPDARTRVPRQRWAYVGGPGTFPTLELLELGGDQLVYIDGRYNIPLDRLQLPFVGPPIVTLRDALGGAAVGRFPTIHQAIGSSLAAERDLRANSCSIRDARNSQFGFGLSLRSLSSGSPFAATSCRGYISGRDIWRP